MLESRIKHQSLSEVVAVEIRNSIWKKELAYGERILEVEMAKHYDISRSTLREALKILEYEKLIINQNRKGSFVNTFTEKDAAEIKEIRLLLEGPALIQASKNLSKENEHELEVILKKLKRSIEEDDWFEAFNLDRDFHLYLVNLCHNSRVIDLYKTLLVQIRTILSDAYDYYVDQKDLYYERQLEVFEAVKGKDEQTIITTIENHIKFED